MIKTALVVLKTGLLAGLVIGFGAGHGFAASVSNTDASAQTLVVTEGASKRELIVAPGETVDFCPSGCFVTMPNGDREALTGSEAVTLKGGKAVIK